MSGNQRQWDQIGTKKLGADAPGSDTVVHRAVPAYRPALRHRWRGLEAVMLFCDRLYEREVLKANRTDRETLLNMLLCDFRNAFPDLSFELQLNFRIINAQALKLQDRRIVTIYGGLALHPKLGAESLSFIILHEAGHHLAEGCRSRHDPSLACECAADYWAATIGADRLQLRLGRRLHLAVATGELDHVMRPRQMSDRGYTKSTSTSGCWAREWSSRRRALLQGVRPPTSEGCCITYV
jgi:hypothetical protein